MLETQKNADFKLGDICADYLDYQDLVHNCPWWLIYFGRKTDRTQEKFGHKDSTLGWNRFGNSVNEM